MRLGPVLWLAVGLTACAEKKIWLEGDPATWDEWDEEADREGAADGGTDHDAEDGREARADPAAEEPAEADVDPDFDGQEEAPDDTVGEGNGDEVAADAPSEDVGDDCPGRERCPLGGYYWNVDFESCDLGCGHRCATPCLEGFRCGCDHFHECGPVDACECWEPSECAFLDPDTNPCNGEEECRFLFGHDAGECRVSPPVVCPAGQVCDEATGECVPR